MELLKKFSEAVANCPVGFNDGLGVRQRGDSGFGGLTTKKVKRVCVSEDVDYVLGLANASIEK